MFKTDIEKQKEVVEQRAKRTGQRRATFEKAEAHRKALLAKAAEDPDGATSRTYRAAKEDSGEALDLLEAAEAAEAEARARLAALERADLERRYGDADRRRTYAQFVTDSEPVVLRILELERSTSAAARELAALMRNASAARDEVAALGAQLGIAQVGGDQPTLDWINRLVAARIKSDNPHPAQELTHYVAIVKELIQGNGGAPASRAVSR